jgi:S-adenosylmethionine-diacylglycerol 3-amino-3-carboxypropyl transferase
MHEYFSGLNYSLANEDTWVEYTLLPESVKRVLAVAGSGARCLPLLAKNPARLDIVDLAEPQLFLAELRVQSIRSLSYDEWLFFMGYRGAVTGDPQLMVTRGELFARVRGLRSETEKYWADRISAWEACGFIALGRWETHFQKLGFLFRNVLKCDFEPVFAAQSLSEQIRIYRDQWPRWRWHSFLKIVASEFVFDRILYKGHFSGKSEHRTEKKTVADFVRDEFERLFTTQLVRKNYFLQTLFLGKIKFEEGLPLEAHRSTFDAIQVASTQVQYLRASMLEPLAANIYDFISLSDTISYLPEDLGNSLLQQIHSETPAHSRIVLRSFLRAPSAMDSQGWTIETETARWAQSVDGTGVYQFQVFSKK